MDQCTYRVPWERPGVAPMGSKNHAGIGNAQSACAIMGWRSGPAVGDDRGLVGRTRWNSGPAGVGTPTSDGEAPCWSPGFSRPPTYHSGHPRSQAVAGVAAAGKGRSYGTLAPSRL